MSAAETTPPEAEADVTAEQQQQQAERRRVIVTLKKKESEWARSNVNVVRSLLPDFGAWTYMQHVREAAASFEMWEHNARTVGEAGLTAEVGTPLVVLCVTTYKRTFQLMRSLPVNLCVTFLRRDRVIWSIVNFNEGADRGDVRDFFQNTMRWPMEQSHVFLWETKREWTRTAEIGRRARRRSGP